MKKIIFTLVVIALTVVAHVANATGMHKHTWRCTCGKKIQVAASNATIADIANYVGGSKVYVVPLTWGEQDPLNPVPSKSMVAALRHASLLLRAGEGYDLWLNNLIDASGNKDIIAGAEGYVDCATGISTAKDGYYWLDPENGKIIAANVLTGLSKIAPSDTIYFKSNYDLFCKKIDENLPKWQTKLAMLKGSKVVSCCGSMEYLYNRFGIVKDNANAKTPILAFADRSVAKFAVVDMLHSNKLIRDAAKENNMKLVEMPSGVGSRGTRDYFELLDKQVDLISSATIDSNDYNKEKKQ